MEKKFLFQPKNIIIIFILMAMLMMSSAMFELYQSKSELYELMEKESHALVGIVNCCYFKFTSKS